MRRKIIYNEREAAEKSGKLRQRVNMVVRLLDESYVPDPTHTWDDIRPFEIASGGSVNEMGDVPLEEIMGRIKTLLRDEIAEDPRDAIEKIRERFSGRKQEGLVDQISKAADSSLDTNSWWIGLRKVGVGYMAIGSPGLRILFTCEPVY
jgi:hypothetical protein